MDHTPYNIYEKEFFEAESRGFLRTVFSRRKSIKYTELVEILAFEPDSRISQTDQWKAHVAQIKTRVKENNLEKYIKINILYLERVGDGGAYPVVPYMIEISRMRIFLRGCPVDATGSLREWVNILNGQVDPNPWDEFGVRFIDNEFVGFGVFKQSQHVGIGTRTSSVPIYLKLSYIEMVNNKFWDVSLILFGEIIIMNKTKMIALDKTYKPSVNIHGIGIPKIRYSIERKEIIDTEQGPASNDVTLINCQFGYLSIDSGGVLRIGGKTQVERFGNATGKVNAEHYYIGSKFSFTYKHSLQFHKNLLMDLLTRSANRKDKSQAKIIQRELDRLDYHIYQTMNKGRIGEWPDFILRTLVYYFKLQLFDRHIWIKTMAGVFAALLVLGAPIYAWINVFEYFFAVENSIPFDNAAEYLNRISDEIEFENFDER